jgi:hypothetical protein
MDRMDRGTFPPLGAPAALPFNPLDAAIGVVTRPVGAMREIAAARPWPIALALAAAIALLGGLVNLTAPLQGAADLTGTAGLPPEFAQTYENTFAFFRSPGGVVANVLGSLIGLAIGSGIFYLIGRLLGGRGPFSGLLSTLAFASIPNILLAPLTAVFNLIGVPFVGGLLGFAVAIWVLVLYVLGIRESLSLSTGRAVATLLIPVGVLLALGCALIALVVALAIGAAGVSP